MAVLASIKTSMIVEKRDASSFQDVNLAVVPQIYRACMGGGGKRETNPAKTVQESLSAAWLDSQDGHGRRGCTFSGRIIATERKETKK